MTEVEAGCNFYFLRLCRMWKEKDTASAEKTAEEMHNWLHEMGEEVGKDSAYTWHDWAHDAQHFLMCWTTDSGGSGLKADCDKLFSEDWAPL